MVRATGTFNKDPAGEGTMARKTGTSMSYATISPGKRRALGRRRRAEEASWAAKSGPVKVYFRESPHSDDLPAA